MAGECEVERVRLNGTIRTGILGTGKNVGMVGPPYREMKGMRRLVWRGFSQVPSFKLEPTQHFWPLWSFAKENSIKL